MSFTLIQEKHISEIDSLARLYRHDGTGARVLSIANSDENKVFGISFRTPSADATGVAHIMEHSVLCGSRKYPVKEPFVELIKGSLNTFLNAMTYPDKTCYPVASANLADFYNLVDVYLDAVFYPAISEDTLRQEGWHYELDAPDAPLSLKGVVFNEMKGAYSDPESRLGDIVQQSLYPDTGYALDSGGDPEVIPELGYDRFKAFHETYYHPANSYIFFYGDDDPAERLRILETWLSDFDAKKVESLPALQSRFDAPRSLRSPYDSGDSPEAKSYVTVNWLLGPRVPESEPAEALGLTLLSHILTATSASPLRRALIESGLGEDLAGAGLADELRQLNYSIGLKGVEAGGTEAVESLILATLRDLAEKGIDPATVKASMNTLEFAMREKNTGRLPRGIAIMLGSLGTWIYDGDPIAALCFEEDFARITAGVEAGGYFEALISRHFLDNPHRTTVVLEPDPEAGRRRESAETERLARVKTTMSQAEIASVIETARALKERQERPDSPEALATIPALKLSDIDPKVKTIQIEVKELEGARLLTHELPTTSILYIDIGFDLHTLPERLVPYIGILGRLLLETGTAREDFISLSQRIGRYTGGIQGSSVITSMRNSAVSQSWFMLRSKVLAGMEDELFAILSDVLLTARIDDRDRFLQIVLEEKAGSESALIPSGHRVVNSRLRSRFTEADRVAEKTEGLESLFFLRTLADRAGKDWPGILEELRELKSLLVNRNAALVNMTADAALLAETEPKLASFLRGLPGTPVVARDWAREAKESGSDPERHSATGATVPTVGMVGAEKKAPLGAQGTEALTLPSQVNFVGKAANLYSLGYVPDGSIHVINKYLQTTWLWEKIRVQGGAYGGFSIFDRNSGVFSFLSYRDPAILPSLKNYDDTAEFLGTLEISAPELEKSIIGTIGDVDAYMLPDAKGYTSMLQYLTGNTPEERQKTRSQILGAGAGDFRAFAEILKKAAETGEIIVMGSPEAIEKAGAEGLSFGAVTRVL